MSDADALMWNVEKDPILRSTVVTVLTFDRSPDWDALVERLERGSRLIPRLRQRVVTPLLRTGPPYWSADPHFDLSYHLRRVRAPEPANFGCVLEFERNAAMAGFDRARPLWEYTVVDGLDGGRSAFVIKVHHSMTDGVGGMKLLMMLFDLEHEPPPPGAGHRAARAGERVRGGALRRPRPAGRSARGGARGAFAGFVPRARHRARLADHGRP